MSFPAQFPAPLPTGMVNRLSNGGMLLCPNGTETLADAAVAFVSYRVLTQTGSVSVSQLTTPEAGQSRALRITQSQATAQRIGLSQAISAINCQDLRTSLLNVSHRARLSATGRTMFALLEWTGTADAQPSDVINDWTSTQYIPGQFFVSTVRVINNGILVADANVWGSAPYIPYQAGVSANNLIYVVWTEDAQAQNATLDLGLWQLAEGAQLLPFEHRSQQIEAAAAYPGLLVVTATGGYPTHTLSDWFYSTGKTGDTALPYTGFWTDVTPLVNIERDRDRHFIGAAVDTPGAFAGTQGSVIPDAAAGADWAVRDSTFTSISPIGRMSVTGIIKTSMQIASPDGGYGAGIGVQAFLINNGNPLGTFTFGWAFYGDVQHETAAGATGWSTGMERAVKNASIYNYTTSPYSWSNAGVFVDWHLVGGDTSYGGANANPLTAIIASRHGNGVNPTANVGWVIKDGTLTTSGGLATMIHMPAGYAFRWDRPNNTLAARIYSEIASAGTIQQSIVFSDSGTLIEAGGLIIAIFVGVASLANRLVFTPGTTGNPFVLSVAGSDTNIRLFIQSKGAADVVSVFADATTNTAPIVHTLRRESTGTPATGIGGRLAWEVETSASNFEIGAAIEAVTTDATAASEDFDMVTYLMAGGSTAVEKYRLRSTGEPVWRPPASAAALAVNGEVTLEFTANTTLTFKGRGSDGTTRSGTITLS